MCRVGRSGCLQRGSGTGLGDARVQDLALCGLLVGEHHVRVNRSVVLSVGVEDLRCWEDGIEPESASLIRDDRHHVLADLLVPHQVLQGTHKRHRRSDLLCARTLPKGHERLVRDDFPLRVEVLALRQVPTQKFAAFLHVKQCWVVIRRLVVRRHARVLIQLFVRNRDLQLVAEQLRVIRRQLLHLVGGVAACERGTKGVALDGVRQDHSGLPGVLNGRLVSSVKLAVVVPTSP